MAKMKYIYSEKATKFCKISTEGLCHVVPVKSTVEISQNFVAFSEYMNLKYLGRMIKTEIDIGIIGNDP